MRNYHDMGGQPARPVDREEHELAHWEKRVEALIAVLARKRLTRSDEELTAKLAEVELATLVTRDSMIGVAQARRPN